MVIRLTSYSSDPLCGRVARLPLTTNRLSAVLDAEGALTGRGGQRSFRCRHRSSPLLDNSGDSSITAGMSDFGE